MNTQLLTRIIKLILYLLPALLFGCGNKAGEFDATGNFEADEIIVSAEATGKIQKLDISEGEIYKAGQTVGWIDTTQLYLHKNQLRYSMAATLSRRPDMSTQLSTITEQLGTARKEKARVENLLKADAATQKQLDDYNAEIELLQKQYDALQSSLQITIRSLQSETLPLKAQLDQLEDQIKKSIIVNPIDGTVLTQYSKQDEVVSPGKAIYKIADLRTITLRAYISGGQLSSIKLGQKTAISVDAGVSDYKHYEGKITWIADKAEFTPKTIQTKDERANLVYAVKIKVNNDGYLKIGMYGEVKFK